MAETVGNAWSITKHSDNRLNGNTMSSNHVTHRNTATNQSKDENTGSNTDTRREPCPTCQNATVEVR